MICKHKYLLTFFILSTKSLQFHLLDSILHRNQLSRFIILRDEKRENCYFSPRRISEEITVEFNLITMGIAMQWFSLVLPSELIFHRFIKINKELYFLSKI